MKTLLSKGMARLAGKSGDTVFHLKQAMGGGKTHLMVGFGLLAENRESLKKTKNFKPDAEASGARVLAEAMRNQRL